MTRPRSGQLAQGRFAQIHNKGEPAPDKEIEEFYASFERWKGLVLWLDMTGESLMKTRGSLNAGLLKGVRSEQMVRGDVMNLRLFSPQSLKERDREEFTLSLLRFLSATAGVA